MASSSLWRMIWRVLVFIAGSVVILVGIVLSLPGIPGPGVVVIVAGVALLATEFAFARRLLRRLREGARKGTSGIRDFLRRRRGEIPPEVPDEPHDPEDPSGSPHRHS